MLPKAPERKITCSLCEGARKGRTLILIWIKKRRRIHAIMNLQIDHRRISAGN
jgi:hypothetical protein